MKLKNTNINKNGEWLIVDANLKIIDKFRHKVTANDFLSKYEEMMYEDLEIISKEEYKENKSTKNTLREKNPKTKV